MILTLAQRDNEITECVRSYKGRWEMIRDLYLLSGKHEMVLATGYQIVVFSISDLVALN